MSAKPAPARCSSKIKSRSLSMRKHMKNFLSALISAFVVVGCATSDSLGKGRGGSTFEVRAKSYDEVWKAAVRTASRSLTIVESNKEDGVLKAEKGAGMATWGEVVGIFITPSKNESTTYTVEIQSLKRATGQLTGQDWTMTMKSGILAELE